MVPYIVSAFSNHLLLRLPFKGILTAVFLCLILPTVALAAGDFQKGFETALSGESGKVILKW